MQTQVNRSNLLHAATTSQCACSPFTRLHTRFSSKNTSRPAIQRRSTSPQAAQHDLTEAGLQSLVHRRTALHGMITAVLCLSNTPLKATAEEGTGNSRGLQRYIKKKKPDPLYTYVPTVLQARAQLLKAGAVMQQDAQAARTLLRKGSFSGLRDTVRVLGEYAAQGGMSQAEAQRIVDTFLRSLQKLDDTIISSARSKTPVPESAGKEVEQAVQDLDRVLATVPPKEIEQAQQLLDEVKAIFAESEKTAKESERTDKEFQALQQLIPGT